MALRDEFLTEIETFLTDTKMDPSTFGRDALKDPNFVFDLREDRAPNLRTIDKVREFIAEYRARVAA